VATHFGKEGFQLALLSRTQAKLDTAVAEFEKTGVTAKGFSVDLSLPSKVAETLKAVSSTFGPIVILFWNPYGAIRPILELKAEELNSEFNLTTTSLVIAVQTVLHDLESHKGKSAVLVTGAALGLDNAEAAQIAVAWGAGTISIAKAAQRKAVHMLHYALKPKDIFVGEVTVLEAVKGTAFDSQKTATLTSEAIAAQFVKLYDARKEAFTSIK